MTKKEFDSKYYGKQVVVLLSTKKNYDKFCKLADNFGYRWNDRIRYVNRRCWDMYEELTCINLYLGLYSDTFYYEDKERTIVEFNYIEDMTPIEILTLQNGKIKVVELLNGKKYMLVGNNLYSKDEYHSLEYYRQDKLKYYPMCKIFEIHARENTCWTFENQDDKLLDLIWSEEKVNFSDLELNIMENIDNIYKYIIREKNGDLCIYTSSPITKTSHCDCFPFSNLYNQLTWENNLVIKIDDYVKRG